MRVHNSGTTWKRYPSWRGRGDTLYYVCVIFSTLYYVRIYMGPFVTNNPRRLDEELIIEGPIKR